jgi:hypothetical protein
MCFEQFIDFLGYYSSAAIGSIGARKYGNHKKVFLYGDNTYLEAFSMGLIVWPISNSNKAIYNY